MPTASVWGPYLWKFLHAFGVKAGKAQPKVKTDESNEARWILLNLDKIIPCKECLAHLVTFKKTHPLPSLSSQYAEWIWNLHESVNQKLSKPPGPPLSLLSMDGNITSLWKDYIKCVEDSIQQNHIRRVNVIEYQRHVLMWLNYLL